MSLSAFDLTIATVSSLHDRPVRPTLILDPELEALFRAGRIEERPARVLTTLHAAWRYLDRHLSSAAARRAVL